MITYQAQRRPKDHLPTGGVFKLLLGGPKHLLVVRGWQGFEFTIDGEWYDFYRLNEPPVRIDAYLHRPLSPEARALLALSLDIDWEHK